MSFLRPEALDRLRRWREALIGGAVLVVSLRVLWGASGVIWGLAATGALIGAALIWEGVRRARWPAEGGGPGVVEVDERQITYLAAFGGGIVSIDQLVRIEIETTDAGPLDSDLFWLLWTREGTALRIPGDAEGADALFDAFAPLQGLDYEAVIRTSGRTSTGRALVWSAPHARLH